MTHRSFRRAIGPFFVLALALGGWGCSSPTATITGTVTVADKPVQAGQISFIAKTGMVYTFNIGADGSYRAELVPTGEMIVLVFGPPAAPALSAGKGAAAKKLSAGKRRSTPVAAGPAGPAVPAAYGEMSTSDLRYTVTAGPNTFSPDLKPAGP
jgi:hypothetical protein